MKSFLLKLIILLSLSTSYNSVFANPDFTDKDQEAGSLEIERSNIFWRYLISVRKSARFDDYLPLSGGNLAHAGTAQLIDKKEIQQYCFTTWESSLSRLLTVRD